MHDVLDLRDLVPDEFAQLLSSGHDAALLHALRPRIDAAVARGDRSELARLWDELQEVSRPARWVYEEPSAPAAVLAAVPPAAPTGGWSGSRDQLLDRTHAAWLGRCIGCCLGKPVEGLTRLEIDTYLVAAGARPFTSYLPLLDPLPAGVSHLHESAPFAAAGLFDCTPRDDDIDWTILALHLLETHGTGFTTADVAAAWLDNLPFTQTFTAERAAYRNLLGGLSAPETATVRNPYREWIGALIRGDAYGYVHPGRPAEAVRLAVTDAVLSHVANGIYGEMWAAALVAEAFASPDAATALEAALHWVPPRTRLREALEVVHDLHGSGLDWSAAMDALDARFAHYAWVHTINNATHVAAGLLWGEGDFTRTVTLTVRAGADTDSAAATAGSVFGALHGLPAVPDHLAEPLHGAVRSAIRGFDRIAISELAVRTVAVTERLHAPAVTGGAVS